MTAPDGMAVTGSDAHRRHSSDVRSVGAIVLYYRNWPLVVDTVRDIRHQGIDRVVVVDNASRDGASRRLRQQFPECRIIEVPHNRGYAAGVNIGMEHLRDCFAVLVCTHEVRLAPGSVDRMLTALTEQVGAVGPVLFDVGDGSLFSAGGKISSRGAILGHRKELPDRTKDVPWVDGACWLLRRTSVDHVGPLDEGYFLYVEEVDYASRLIRGGWRVVCEPSARAWQSPGAVPEVLYWRNWIRWRRRTEGLSACIEGTFLAARMAVVAARHRRWRRSFVLGGAVIAYWLRLPPAWLARRRTGAGTS